MRGDTRTVFLIWVRCLVITQIKGQGTGTAQEATPEAGHNTQRWFAAVAMEADRGVKFHRGRSGLSWTWKKKPLFRLFDTEGLMEIRKKEEQNPRFIMFHKRGAIKLFVFTCTIKSRCWIWGGRCMTALFQSYSSRISRIQPLAVLTKTLKSNNYHFWWC